MIGSLVTYTGDVTPGGPPAVRELTDLTITKVSVGPMDNNAYLLRCRATGEQLLIDAANEAARLLELIGDGGLSTVVTTHQHMDHWVALEEVVAGDRRPLGGARRRRRRRCRSSTRPVTEGDTITRRRLRPGGDPPGGAHPGSIALLYRDPAGIPHLFTGD